MAEISIRIDTKLKNGGFLYLFVRARHEKWHQWWKELFTYLMKLESRIECGINPETGAKTELLTLAGDGREQLLNFLQTAPAVELKEHRALRRTIDLMQESNNPIRVMYFFYSAGK